MRGSYKFSVISKAKRDISDQMSAIGEQEKGYAEVTPARAG